MQKLTPSTIAILKALANGDCIEYRLEPHKVFVGRCRRVLCLKFRSLHFTEMRALLNRAFDILCPRGLIAGKAAQDGTDRRVYTITPLGILYLKGLCQ